MQKEMKLDWIQTVTINYFFASKIFEYSRFNHLGLSCIRHPDPIAPHDLMELSLAGVILASEIRSVVSYIYPQVSIDILQRFFCQRHVTPTPGYDGKLSILSWFQQIRKVNEAPKKRRLTSN